MRRSGMTAKLWESAEFQLRQLAFDFGRVARAVVPIIAKLRRQLRAWEHLRPRSPSPASTWCQPALTLLLPTHSATP